MLFRSAKPTAAAGKSGDLYEKKLATVAGSQGQLGTDFTLARALDAIVKASQDTARGSVIQYDARTNSFLVTATEVLITQLKQIIERVDVEPTQIFVEVRFISTKDNNFNEHGISFGGSDTTNGITFDGPFPNGVSLASPVGLGQTGGAGAAAT